jgi:Membrane proteins related to metalloendopeptidases
MESLTYIFGGLLTALTSFLLVAVDSALNYIWPLSKSTMADPMNTSFGPRINNKKWDFHDGIDLPAPKGTSVYAMREGAVYSAGNADASYASRHVVLKVTDPNEGLMYLVYFHLDSIAQGITVGVNVNQGDLLGTVGDDGATYPHLHIEFRKGANHEVNSVHPLGYLPYGDTPNFTPPVVDRFNRSGGLMAARLLFAGNSRLEGDLQRVEVDLKSGAALLQTRLVDFNNKTTVNEGNDDGYTCKGDVGVEGYQTSNMSGQGQNDLKYGILVRNLPVNCDTLVGRVIDVGNHTVTSGQIAVPNQTLTDISVDFEDGLMPPGGWAVVSSSPGAGTAVTNDASAAHSGSRGMLCTDSSTAAATQSAAIECALPGGRFEWNIEGWFKPTVSNLTAGQYIYLLHFLNGTNFSVAARIRHNGTSLVAGIAYQALNNASKSSDSSAVINIGAWRKWRLSLLRLATRETTAVLYLDDGAQLVEQVRVNWDSTGSEPLSARAGVTRSSLGATVTMMVDDIRLTEATL